MAEKGDSAREGIRGEHKAKEKARKQDTANQILIENFVSLQHVLANLSVKFDNLSSNISKLLQLFEMSARSFLDKMPAKEVEKDKEFLHKLDALLDQNKTIAKGLTLMEEKFKERVYGQTSQASPSPPTNQEEVFSTGILNQPIKKLPQF